jgi:hypothetical protein
MDISDLLIVALIIYLLYMALSGKVPGGSGGGRSRERSGSSSGGDRGRGPRSISPERLFTVKHYNPPDVRPPEVKWLSDKPRPKPKKKRGRKKWLY